MVKNGRRMQAMARGVAAALVLGSLLIGLPSPSLAQDPRGVSIQKPTTPQAPAEKRVALVIGNGAYKSATALANPPNDANAVAEVLKTTGFELIGGKAMVDLDRTATEQAIRTFGRKLREGAVGLFYYAGHGIQVAGANYLVPVSANLTSESDVKYELVDVNFVLDEMVQANNRLNVVILDACRNNPFGGRGLRSVTGGGLAQMQAPSGTVISYATQPGNVAADGVGSNHSPFTEALTQSIKTPGRNVFDVFNEVGLAVKKKTGGVQQPWLATSPIEGQFFFIPPATQTAALTSPTPTVAQPAYVNPDKEAMYWDSIKDSNNPAYYRAYLEQFPTGVFAGLARAKLGSSAPTAPAVTPAVAPAAAMVPFDPAKVPFAKLDATELKNYQNTTSQKALAIGSNGVLAWQSKGSTDSTPDDLRRRVLERCQYRNKAPCILYAVDNQVVATQGANTPPSPVNLRLSGRFDPAQMPFVRQSIRDTKMVDYQKARTHKAVAITVGGSWAFVSNRDSVEEAEEEALENCAEFQETGCRIYALDDEVVFGQSDTTSRSTGGKSVSKK